VLSDEFWVDDLRLHEGDDAGEKGRQHATEAIGKSLERLDHRLLKLDF
jgi:hypothetical protein